MDNVGCEGTEDSLNDCRHNTEEDCGVTEGAGVVCDTRDVILSFKTFQNSYEMI